MLSINPTNRLTYKYTICIVLFDINSVVVCFAWENMPEIHLIVVLSHQKLLKHFLSTFCPSMQWIGSVVHKHVQWNMNKIRMRWKLHHHLSVSDTWIHAKLNQTKKCNTSQELTLDNAFHLISRHVRWFQPALCVETGRLAAGSDRFHVICWHL